MSIPNSQATSRPQTVQQKFQEMLADGRVKQVSPPTKTTTGGFTPRPIGVGSGGGTPRRIIDWMLIARLVTLVVVLLSIRNISVSVRWNEEKQNG